MKTITNTISGWMVRILILTNLNGSIHSLYHEISNEDGLSARYLESPNIPILKHCPFSSDISPQEYRPQNHDSFSIPIDSQKNLQQISGVNKEEPDSTILVSPGHGFRFEGENLELGYFNYPFGDSGGALTHDPSIDLGQIGSMYSPATSKLESFDSLQSSIFSIGSSEEYSPHTLNERSLIGGGGMMKRLKDAYKSDAESSQAGIKNEQRPSFSQASSEKFPYSALCSNPQKDDCENGTQNPSIHSVTGHNFRNQCSGDEAFIWDSNQSVVCESMRKFGNRLKRKDESEKPKRVRKTDDHKTKSGVRHAGVFRNLLGSQANSVFIKQPDLKNDFTTWSLNFSQNVWSKTKPLINDKYSITEEMLTHAIGRFSVELAPMFMGALCVIEGQAGTYQKTRNVMMEEGWNFLKSFLWPIEILDIQHHLNPSKSDLDESVTYSDPWRILMYLVTISQKTRIKKEVLFDLLTMWSKLHMPQESVYKGTWNKDLFLEECRRIQQEKKRKNNSSPDTIQSQGDFQGTRKRKESATKSCKSQDWRKRRKVWLTEGNVVIDSSLLNQIFHDEDKFFEDLKIYMMEAYRAQNFEVGCLDSSMEKIDLCIRNTRYSLYPAVIGLIKTTLAIVVDEENLPLVIGNTWGFLKEYFSGWIQQNFREWSTDGIFSKKRNQIDSDSWADQAHTVQYLMKPSGKRPPMRLVQYLARMWQEHLFEKNPDIVNKLQLKKIKFNRQWNSDLCKIKLGA